MGEDVAGELTRPVGPEQPRDWKAVKKIRNSHSSGETGSGNTRDRRHTTTEERHREEDRHKDRQDTGATSEERRKELEEMYPDLLGEVSVRTVQVRLQKDLKLLCRRAAQKPLLTKNMKKQWVDFCKRHADWTQENWRRVMFSDESAFKTISRRQKLVRRPSGSDRFDSHYTVKTVKLPAGVMVWGSFSGEKGTGGRFQRNLSQFQVKFVPGQSRWNLRNTHLLKPIFTHPLHSYTQQGM
ncbi:hypothetical protein Pmani_013315 [Petrolisthes manimaculis]|uniref:Transposase n=1 Tax=Petrolisthes manimaculis TaxID=1843537 RepID=A0AAE1PW54_9EUCA|nr:hypothetical protein Pmani_013315 [Petrolisthes manimaculis]